MILAADMWTMCQTYQTFAGPTFFFTTSTESEGRKVPWDKKKVY
jgi:hypothetical protein